MSSPDSLDFAEIALALEEARKSATPIDFITSSIPDLNWDDARAIARLSDGLRRDAGEAQIGWKLGWTSEAMRTALGIDRPNWGTLWNAQLAGSELTLANYIHPKVEPELVWRSPADISGDATASAVAALGGHWAVGIEVVDPRFPSFGFEALDNTADNSSSAAIRLGEFSAVDSDLSELEVTFSNHDESRIGLGRQAMSSPWEAVAWLARSLHEEGLQIQAGDIVFTGGLTAPFDATVGISYRVEGTPLDSATLRFT